MKANQSDEPVADKVIHRDLERGRVRWLLLVATVFLVMTIGVLWLQRAPITAAYLNGQLSQRGVTARYRISNLTLGRQRLTDVVIGNPAQPDLIADWVELRTHVGLSGFTVDAIRAGHLRLRGRVADGRLTLGDLDKLLPARAGGRFALPAIAVDVVDARMRLETVQGLVGIKASGRGMLSGGFAGQLAVVSRSLNLGNCTAQSVSVVVALKIGAGQPTFRGPARAGRITCGIAAMRSAGATLNAITSRSFNRWSGSAAVTAVSVRANFTRLDEISGSVVFDGGSQRTVGDLALKSGSFATALVTGTGLGIDGRYEMTGKAANLKGSVRVARATVSPKVLAGASAWAVRASGTPVATLADRFGHAVAAAGRAFAIDAEFAASTSAGGGAVSLSRANLFAESGARAVLNNSDGTFRWPQSTFSLSGTLAVGSGGLPKVTVRFDRPAPGRSVNGLALISPYATADARLSFTPIAFTVSSSGKARIKTMLGLSGSIGGGRVDGLTIPIEARWDGRKLLTVDAACTPVSFNRLVQSGLVLLPARFSVCPLGGALLAVDNGIVQAGGRIAAPRIAGTLGSSPVAVTAPNVDLSLSGPTFAAKQLAIQIGGPAQATWFNFVTLNGRAVGGALNGQFTEGAGQIGNLPLRLGHALGKWSFRNGALAVTGAVSVTDRGQPERFKELAGRNVVLILASGRLTATGTLATPTKGIEVATVRIVHELASGAGHADIVVPGITFGKSLQPDDLTSLTYGVMADVAGTVLGEGHIRWNASNVTSTGTFKTTGTNLAAAFGPVTGVSGTIHFTDLLSLQSAPGQVALIKSLNPGVAVTDGTIRYQTLPNARIRIEEGRWPFAGGALVLEPTMLNFGDALERRITFGVSGIDAAQFLQQFDFKNLNATGTFDGVLPMIFDAQGGRIEKGELRVQSGGGAIAYVGQITQNDLGTWGNLAFQALKSLKYRSLNITMDGPLAGEMITQVRFAGVGQGEGAKRNFLVARLAKLPLVFNVRIAAPFRSLIDSAASFYDPQRLIEHNLPALIDEQNRQSGVPAVPAGTPLSTAPRPIQPSESRSAP